MEVKMQTSFIPKKPIVESRPGSSGVSLFLLLSIIIFIVAIALAGGIWLWQKSLISQIDKDKQALIDAKDSYEEGTINPLIRLNNRIEESKILLANHLAISPVFTMLEQNVLRNIRLKNMKFSYAANNKIRIDLTGTAADYDALSKQSDAFGSDALSKFISGPVVSDFNPTPDGSISFNFTATVDPILVSYENTLGNSVNIPTSDISNNAASSTQ
jgi:hypothetical protein